MLCTGKVYFDLLEEQQKNSRQDVAIIRLEQLAPLPRVQLAAELEKYEDAKIYWVQEEPENMGAWTYILRIMRNNVEDVIARKASASPATGYNKVHAKEQQDIIDRAFSV